MPLLTLLPIHKNVKSFSCVWLFAIPWTVAIRLLCPWNSPSRILEQVVIPFSRGSLWPRDQTQISCITGRLFTIWATREALSTHKNSYQKKLLWLLVNYCCHFPIFASTHSKQNCLHHFTGTSFVKGTSHFYVKKPNRCIWHSCLLFLYSLGFCNTTPDFLPSLLTVTSVPFVPLLMYHGPVLNIFYSSFQRTSFWCHWCFLFLFFHFLTCCDSWGCKESDTTERLIWSDLITCSNFHYFLPSTFLMFTC